MKAFFTTNTKLVFLAFLILSIFTVIIFAEAGGRSGRTLKTSTLGCGTCHGSSPTSGVAVTISGPDTVIVGQTNQYSLTITRSTKTGAGLNIAVSKGTLSPVSSGIGLLNDELVNNINLPMSGGTITVLFNYNAPASSTIDTIWATGLASNSDGTQNGDEWNWAQSKWVFVRPPIGIINQSKAVEFKLNQNYPNPFNASTIISFELLKASYAKLTVHDISGNPVATLVNSKLNEGYYEVNWNGGNFASGIYFYKLENDEFSITKKMILAK